MDYLLIEDEEIVIFLHDLIMYNKEVKGLRDGGNLHFALYDCKSAKYNGILEISAALMFNIIRGHCFYDGNKRTALLSAATLLLFNGYDLIEMPLLYADYLVNMAKKAPDLEDKEVLIYIKNMAKELNKYVKKDEEAYETLNKLANEIKNKKDLTNKSIKYIREHFSKKISSKLDSLKEIDKYADQKK